MATVDIIVCNACSELLYGKYGKEQIARPYISIQGRVCLQNIDARRDGKPDPHIKPWYMFVSRSDDEHMCFCDTACFASYLDMRKGSYKKKREENLRQETTRTYRAREEWEYNL